MGRLRRGLGVLVVGSVVLAGCGGGDKKVSSSTPTTVGGQTSATDGGRVVEGVGGALNASDCFALATTMAEAYGGVAQAMANYKEALGDDLALFQAFADKAPAEIRDDFRVVGGAFAEFVKVMQDTNFNPAAGQVPSPDALAKLAAATEKLETSEFTDAAARVSAWFEKQCPGS